MITLQRYESALTPARERTTMIDWQALAQEHFGFSDLKPGQEQVLDALDTHGAALAVFPTGGGKSLCYQLPALLYEGVTVVVSPLIALMKDQIDFLQSKGVAAARLDSSLTTDEARAINDQLFHGTLKLLYVAPERFNNERFLERLKRTRIALFAVDEAHCISEWGHNFRPDYLKLAEACRAIEAPRVLALTATATPAVVRDICAVFNIPDEAAVVTGFYRPNLNMSITPVTSEGRDDLLVKRLKTRKPGSGIVYVTLQKTAERLATRLQDEGFEARAYHAGMEPDVRTEVQEWWMESDHAIVVATIAFGMGIDKSDVRYVYHYNLPKSLESYSQEIGRAGRDGLKSTVEMLACPDDVPVLENFAYGDTPSETALRGLIHELLGLGSEFDVSMYDLSNRHDIRMLVLRTAMTYLELLGVLKQGTPFYAGYEFRMKADQYELQEGLGPDAYALAIEIIKKSKQGRTWYGLDPDELAQRIGRERADIVAALEEMEERGFAEVRAANVRNRYTRLRPSEDAEELTQELARRFHGSEDQEMVRIQQVLGLASQDSCQVNALVGYFGEERDAPCGHCTYCVTGKPGRVVVPRGADGPLLSSDDEAEWRELRREYSQVLGDSRQAARFLCGLSSPAMTRARLSRHPFFGKLEERRFGDVLAWCSEEAVGVH